MSQHRHAFTDRSLLGSIAIGQQSRLAMRLFGQLMPPGIDDEAMAVGFPSAGMNATLGRGQHIALGFDGA